MKVGRSLIGSLIVFLIGYGQLDHSFSKEKDAEMPVAVILPAGHKFDESSGQLETGAKIALQLLSRKQPKLAKRIGLKFYPHAKSLASMDKQITLALADNVKFFIAGEHSHETMFLGDVLTNKNVLLISPTSTNPNITKNKPFVFSVAPSDSYTAKKLAKFVLKNLKSDRIGVLHNISRPYPNFVSEAFVNELKHLNAESKLLFHAKFIKGQNDFAAYVKELKGKNVEIVASFLYDSEFFKFVTEAFRQDYFPIYIGSASWGGNRHIFEHLVKNQKKGSHFKAYRDLFYNSTEESSLLTELKSIYRSQSTGEMGAWIPMGFNAAWLLFQAMSIAKNPRDPAEIQALLKSQRMWENATSNTFAMGADGFAQKPLFIYKIFGQPPVFFTSL